MTRVVFSPFPTAPDGVLSTYRTAGGVTAESGGQLDARGRSGDELLELEVTTSVGPGVMENLCPPEERHEPPLQMVVTARSIESRLRRSFPLVREDGSTWSGTIVLDPSQMAGQVQLGTHLVRARRGSSTSHADQIGARLSWDQPVEVVFDDRPLSSGGYLELRYEDFSASGDAARRRQKEQLFGLELSGENPVLYLNEAVPDLKRVLEHTGTRGATVRARDAAFATVATQVWTTLGAASVTALTVALAAPDAPTAEEVVAGLPEWQQRVLRQLAPSMYDGDRDGTVDALVADLVGDPTAMHVHTLLGFAAQRQARVPHAFQGLVRLETRDGV